MKSGKDLANKIAALASAKKANDILILKMENISSVTDYYVICSAGNNVLVQAIADNIEDELAKEDILCQHKEGYNEGHWILLDYSTVVVHVFLVSEMEFYNLEQLWAYATSENFKE